MNAILERANMTRHPNLITRVEAYALLGVGKDLAYKAEARDHWPRVQIGGKVYYKRRELLAIYGLEDVAA